LTGPIFLCIMYFYTQESFKMTVAIISNLSIEKLEAVRPIYRALAKAEGKKMRIRFRGPRYDAMRLHCLKKNARAFSVYFD